MSGYRPLVVCCLVLWPALAHADVIHLKDGSSVEGNITRTAEGWEVRDAAGRVSTIKASDVVRLEARAQGGADVAQSRLNSLRRSVDNATDPAKVIERFDAFIKQYPNTPAADGAKADLATWRERLNQRMVKVADKWLSPEDAASARADALVLATQARALMMQTRFKDAGEAVDRILAIDPQQPAGLYLRGVLLHDQQQIVPSRKAFEGVQTAMPDHAPTLNNLAVLTWQTRQYPAALNFYDQAIAAMPVNRYLLDNVAEALHMLPSEYRNNATTKKLVKHFNEQDNLLQSRLAKQDLYRWGSTWVSGSELDKLQATEKRIQERIEALEIDYQEAQDRIDRLDGDIRDMQRELRRYETYMTHYDAQGRSVHTPPPRAYYETMDDLKQLRIDREEEVKKVDGLRRKARSIQKELTPARFMGQQRLIGAEGAPLPPVALESRVDPTTRPGRIEDAPAPAATKADAPKTKEEAPAQAPYTRKGLLDQ